MNMQKIREADDDLEDISDEEEFKDQVR